MQSILNLNRQGWYAVSTDDIPVQQLIKKTLFKTPLVLWRNTFGDIKIYKDACPHRGYPLSEGTIVRNDLVCKYHGWCFNHQGECSNLPGLDGTPRFKLQSVDFHLYEGLIWVNLAGNVEFDISHTRPKLQHEFTWHYELAAPAYLLIENTLDPMHTPYIHAGLVRSEKEEKKEVEILIKNNEKFVEAVYQNEGGQSGLISKLFSPPDVDGIGRFIAPGILELEFKSPAKTYISFTAYLAPQSNDSVSIILKTHYSSLRFRLDLLIKPLFKFILRRVIQQDINVCLAQYENLKAFPNFKYQSTKLDYMLPYIDGFLRGNPKESGEREIKILI